MLKIFLTTHFPELKPQLDIAKSFDNVLDAVKGMCTLININYLETIVDHYNIVEAKACIIAYKLVIDKFCEEVKLSMCRDEIFLKDPSSVPKNESIVFVLNWSPHECTFSDIMHLLEKGFGRSGPVGFQVITVKSGDGGSIIVTCHMPKLANRDQFKKNFESELLLID